MKTNTFRLTIIVVVVGILFGVAYALLRPKPKPLEAAFSDLRSGDFMKIRKAQNQILAEGHRVVPNITLALQTETNEVAQAILVYLLGELNPRGCMNALTSAPSTGLKISIAIRYLDAKIFDKISNEERRRLISGISNRMNELPENEKNGVQSFIEKLGNRK